MKSFSNKSVRVSRRAGACVSTPPNARITRAVPAMILLCCLRIFAFTDGALILEHANSNENIYSAETGDFISYLRGDVVFLFEDLRLSADEATWQRNAGIVDFSHNVRVEQRGQVMTCNRLHFERDKNVLTAAGNVFYRDSAGVTFMSGQTAEYATDKRECVLRGDPLLTRIDSTEVDTLFISGVIMVYNDSLKRATIVDDVKINRGSLTATCRRGEYFTNTNIALLRIFPVIHYESHRVTGDSVDLVLGKETLESARVIGGAHGLYTGVSETSGDTTRSNVWGDSLHLSMFESGKINSMRAVGNARGDFAEVDARTGNLTKTNITSDSLQLFMFETGKVSAMKAFGSAHGRYAEIAAASGKAPAADMPGDSLRLPMFDAGKVSAAEAPGSGADKGAPPERDSSITHIWGDSLRVSMLADGKINTMRAFGNVLSRNFIAGDSARASEVSGQRLALRFSEDGKIERAVVIGDAKSIYFVEESDGGGCNIAGGDRITVMFSRGKAQRLQVRGNARGIYFP